MIDRALLCIIVTIALASAACANVAPYERGRLAHPSMAPNDAASLSREHLHALQEGASGGDVLVSSGCGCN